MSFHQQLMVHVSQYVKQISTKICQKIVTNTKPHQSHRGALRRNGKIVLVTPGHRVVVQKRWDAVLRWFYDTEIQPSTPSGMHKSCKSWDKPTITVTAGFQASSLDDVNSQQVQLHSHKHQDAPSVFPTMITWYTWSSFAILTTKMKPHKTWACMFTNHVTMWLLQGKYVHR